MKEKANAVLLIVDPQVDFISGSMAVPDGMKAMDWLAQYVEQNAQEYSSIFITMDQHPLDHCSFTQQGGQWPSHCVKYSEGAAIYPPLMLAIQNVRDKVNLIFIEKAISADKDAYSAFESMAPTMMSEADRIDVAGIAGDYCVKASIEDLVKHGLGDKINRLEEGIAYINKPE